MDKSDVVAELQRLVPSLEDLELLARPLLDSERRGFSTERREPPVEARTLCGRGVQLGDLEEWRPVPRPGDMPNVIRAQVGRRLLLLKDRQLVEQNMVLFNYGDDRYEWWAGRNGRGSTTPISWGDALEVWTVAELGRGLAEVLEQARQRRLKTVESLGRRRQAALQLCARAIDEERKELRVRLLGPTSPA